MGSKKISDIGINNWSNYYTNKEVIIPPTYPSESMLRIIFGQYLNNPINLSANSKVLDVGCGRGNNLVPFIDRGYECYGVEVTQEAADSITTALSKQGYNINIKEGTNTSIPYSDNTFDLLLSINVLHYENSEENIQKALEEYKRVLKDGGTLYLSTVGPNHEIYQLAEIISPHLYKIKEYDFRNDEVYFYFDNEKYLKNYLSKYFSNVEIGSVNEKLMTRELDFMVALCR